MNEMKQKLEKINKAKSQFCEEINRIDKPLEIWARNFLHTHTGIPISGIRKDVTTVPNIRKIIREEYEQLTVNLKFK